MGVSGGDNFSPSPSISQKSPQLYSPREKPAISQILIISYSIFLLELLEFPIQSFSMNLTTLAMKSRQLLIIPAALVALGMGAIEVSAQNMYNPISMEGKKEITDTLTEKDIPTGQGGFARDYVVNLQEGDQVAIDLISESFDAIVSLLGPDGTTVAENDDGPDGTTNSLLFSRITTAGDYIVRVRAFGEGGVGEFQLKVTRLRPI